MTTPKWVVVEWLDAASYNEMHDTGPAVIARSRLIHRFTGGWLLQYGKELTKLAHDYDPVAMNPELQEDHFGNITVMPTGWVIAVRHGRKKIAMEENGVAASTPASAEIVPKVTDGPTP